MLAVTRDGNTAFTTNEGTSTLSRLDLTSRQFVSTFPASEGVEGIVVTNDGKELWAGEHAESAVKVRDAVTGQVLATFTGFRYPVKLVISPDGRRIAISDLGCKTISVADPATRRIIRTIRGPRGERASAGTFSPDGSVLFASVWDDRVVVALDIENGRELGRFKVGRAPDGLGWGPTPAR